MITYTHSQSLDGRDVTVEIEFEGDILPNAYKWPGPVRELTGTVSIDGDTVWERTTVEEQPKRSFGRGDVSETFGGALWGRKGSDFWRAVRRSLKSRDDRLRALLGKIL